MAQLLLLVAFCLASPSAWAAVTFQQDFEGIDFLGEDFTAPLATARAAAFSGGGANEFDGLLNGPGSIWRAGTDPFGNQSLAITRNPDTSATFTINSVGGVTDLMYFQFDVIVPQIAIGAGLGAGIQIGDGYNPVTTSAENGALSFARLGFNLFPAQFSPGGPEARLFVPEPERVTPAQDPNNQIIINGSEPRIEQAQDNNNDGQADAFAYMRFTWALNSSNATLVYDSPLGANETLDSDTHDLFIEYRSGVDFTATTTLRVLDDHPAQSPGTTLDDIKFFLNPSQNFAGSIVFDNLFVMDSLPDATDPLPAVFNVPLAAGAAPPGLFGGIPAVPEPAGVLLMAMATLGLWRSRR